jgi:hypothetical protein
LILPKLQQQQQQQATASAATVSGSGDGGEANPTVEPTAEEQLAEPLLSDEENAAASASAQDTATPAATGSSTSTVSFGILLGTSLVLFWSAALLASLVSSIDVVWDLLGSSLSILMSYLIPAGTFLVISKRHRSQNDNNGTTTTTTTTTLVDKLSTATCWLLLVLSVPLMVGSTANAVVNTFGQR